MKFWKRSTEEKLTICEGEHATDHRMIRLHPLQDKFLFRKSPDTLQEFRISQNYVKFVREFKDDRYAIDDFAYYKHEVVIMTKEGVMKRIFENGNSKRFEIEPGKPKWLTTIDGRTFKIDVNQMLEYCLISYNKLTQDVQENVAYVVELAPNEVKFINKVAFDTGVEFDLIRESRFDLLSGNFPAFLLITSMSNICLIFALHGIKIIQVGEEIDLGDNYEWSMTSEGNTFWIASGDGKVKFNVHTVK